MKFTAELKDKHGSVWGTHIIVPKKISKAILDKKIKRLLCTLNDKLQVHCALMPNGEKEYYLVINKDNVKELKARIGDEVSVLLEEDKSKYGMPMPEEFEEILYQDPDVDKLFHALTPGKQRSLLYMIGKPKGVESRLKKAIVIAEYLKDCKGKLDYKELNIAFKNYAAR